MTTRVTLKWLQWPLARASPRGAGLQGSGFPQGHFTGQVFLGVGPLHLQSGLCFLVFAKTLLDKASLGFLAFTGTTRSQFPAYDNSLVDLAWFPEILVFDAPWGWGLEYLHVDSQSRLMAFIRLRIYPTMGHGLSLAPTNPTPIIQKRSYKRDCKRALVHGCSWYKGSRSLWMTLILLLDRTWLYYLKRWFPFTSIGSKPTTCTILMGIIRHHGLVALNTWDSSLGPAFVHGSLATRSDFVLTRLDFQAKQVRILHDAPFLTSQEYCHFLSLVVLPRFESWIEHLKLQGLPYVKDTRCAKNYGFMIQCVAPVHQLLLTAWPFPQMNHRWSFAHQDCSVCSSIFENHAYHAHSARTHTHTQATPQYVQLESKWKHTRMARKSAGSVKYPNLSDWFRCWFHVTRAI